MKTSQQHVATIAVTAAATAGFLWMYNNLCNKKESPVNGTELIPTELRNSPFAEELALAVKLAQLAGDNMIQYMKSNTACEDDSGLGPVSLEINQKSGEVDFSTQVDIENEKLVVDGIRQAFPTHQIIGEEGVGTGEVPRLAPGTPTWIIDPIDGTTNFSVAFCMTCVSIGFCSDEGKPVMGVIYAPATKEWYMAVKGHGAFCNGRRILPNKHKNNDMSKAVVCCEFGYSRKQEEIDAMLGAVSRILAKGCRAIRQLGSGCLDLCYVATGQLDVVYAGVVNEGWKPWDYAAGLVICTEAGCVMESIDQTPGDEFDLYSKSILCGTNRALVDECRKLLRP